MGINKEFGCGIFFGFTTNRIYYPQTAIKEIDMTNIISQKNRTYRFARKTHNNRPRLKTGQDGRSPRQSHP